MKKILSVIFKIFGVIFKYLFPPLLLLSGVVATGFIIYFLVFADSESTRNQLLIGLAASLFSTVVGTNSVIGLFSSKVKSNLEKSKETTKLIDSFNLNYLDDLSLLIRILKNANESISYKVGDNVFIDSNKNPVNQLPSGINYVHYKAEIIKYTFYYNYGKPGVISENVIKYLSENTDYSKNTIGNLTVYTLFRQKRIKVLNYFENMAIGISNRITLNDVLKSQFSGMLSEIIPLFLIFIYNEEGEVCYPALRALMLSWYRKEKKK